MTNKLKIVNGHGTILPFVLSVIAHLIVFEKILFYGHKLPSCCIMKRCTNHGAVDKLMVITIV